MAKKRAFDLVGGDHRHSDKLGGTTYRLAFVPGSTDGMHLWRGSVGPAELYKYSQVIFPEKHHAYCDQMARHLFCSETFWEAIMKRGMTGLRRDFVKDLEK